MGHENSHYYYTSIRLFGWSLPVALAAVAQIRTVAVVVAFVDVVAEPGYELAGQLTVNLV